MASTDCVNAHDWHVHDAAVARSPVLIQADKLYFSWKKDAPPLLKNVSCQIENSSRIGMLGANGAGKSTLIKLLLKKEIEPNKGTVRNVVRRSFSMWMCLSTMHGVLLDGWMCLSTMLCTAMDAWPPTLFHCQRKTRHDDAEQAGAGMVYMPMLLTCSFVQIVVMWVQASCRVAVFAQHHVDQLDLSISPIEFLQKQFTDMTTQECRNVLGTFGACS